MKKGWDFSQSGNPYTPYFSSSVEYLLFIPKLRHCQGWGVFIGNFLAYAEGWLKHVTIIHLCLFVAI